MLCCAVLHIMLHVFAVVRVCDPCFFSLSGNGAERGSSQLYGQLQAMEEVSQALMLENRQVQAVWRRWDLYRSVVIPASRGT